MAPTHTHTRTHTHTQAHNRQKTDLWANLKFSSFCGVDLKKVVFCCCCYSFSFFSSFSFLFFSSLPEAGKRIGVEELIPSADPRNWCFLGKFVELRNVAFFRLLQIETNKINRFLLLRKCSADFFFIFQRRKGILSTRVAIDVHAHWKWFHKRLCKRNNCCNCLVMVTQCHNYQTL